MKKLIIIAFLAINIYPIFAQEHSVAREWNEFLLESIRKDRARPTVHARNLFHISAIMYDCWAAYDEVAKPYFLDSSHNGFMIPFEGVPTPADKEAAVNEAISFACYTFLRSRYRYSPGYFFLIQDIEVIMEGFGYDTSFTGEDYESGNPAALGNYIANQVIAYGFQDGSNEQTNYANLHYSPSNLPLFPEEPGNPDITDLNKWQPLTLSVSFDQSGNPQPNTPPFLSPEWGAVHPFALSMDDANVYNRDDFDYIVYHDPGPPPTMDSILASEEYKWGFSMVPIWSSHLNTEDNVMWDISPASRGNLTELPDTFEEYPDYYDQLNGGIYQSNGHDVNPTTGLPYEPNMVNRGDYTRVLAEFWADGPESETPPGHWFTILNYVLDHPEFVKNYRGFHYIEDQLEYDVKAYFMLGAAMHDCAITAWGIKGYYDYIRPVSAVRAMAVNGQSTDPALPNYSNLGIPLVPGKIELVEAGDPLEGSAGQHIGKVKIFCWQGPDYIEDPLVDKSEIGWILGENWWPYQRPSFVTPNFAGYISGHSTYSRAAAEILTMITGDEYFPGGMGEFEAKANEFLVFEEGPTEDVILQWATYRDASDETSLSRIWGGIHPPADDIPGRKIGIKIADDVFSLAEQYFYIDEDDDGFYNYEDCDDLNPLMNPALAEICDDYDNNCNGIVNDGVTLNTYYLDDDQDGFGESSISIDTCIMVPPPGYVANADDCNDGVGIIYPGQTEVCDAIDNDCDGVLNNGLARYTYFLDFDGDGYGDNENPLDTCISNPPDGFVVDNTDCNDNANHIYPTAIDIPDNEVDEDCSGLDYYEETKYLPNIVVNNSNKTLEVRYEYEGNLECKLYSIDGKLITAQTINVDQNRFFFDLQEKLPPGIYVFRMTNEETKTKEIVKITLI